MHVADVFHVYGPSPGRRHGSVVRCRLDRVPSTVSGDDWFRKWELPGSGWASPAVTGDAYDGVSYIESSSGWYAASTDRRLTFMLGVSSSRSTVRSWCRIRKSLIVSQRLRRPLSSSTQVCT